MGDVFCTWQAIVGQLHDERCHVALVAKPFGEQRCDDADEDAQKIEANQHQAAMAREEIAREEAVDRDFGRTAHERRQQDGAPTVVGGMQGARGHHRRHGTAEADEHGHDAVAGETEFAQEAVADESHTGHIAAVFEQAEEEEQQDDDRHETEHAAHAAKDAVDDERLHGGTDVPVGQSGAYHASEPADALVEPVLQGRTKGIDAEPDDAHHDEDENRDGGPFAGQDFVDFAAAAVFLAFLGLDYCLVAQLFNEGETHLSHGCGAVEAAFLFHLNDEVLQCLFLVLGELQGFEHDGVAFHEFGSSKAHGDVGALGMVLDEVHDAMEATVHGAAVVVLVTEVLTCRGFLVFRYMEGVVDQLIDAFVFGSRDGHHGQAQNLLHLVHEDAAAIVAHFVHHVECQNHGFPQFHELHGEVEVALDVVGINDVDDGFGLLLHDELARNHFFVGVRRKRVDARQVGDRGVGMAFDDAVLAVDGDAWEVADMLVGPRQLVEEGRLAAVLLSGKGESELGAFGQRMLVCLVVIDAFLAEARVGVVVV